MLPDRSKRYAGVDGEIPRLALTTHWQLALIALLVLVLLTLIFPRRALVEKLYQQKTLDELTLSYIQNLYRAEPGNADVALLLARSRYDQLSVASLEALVLRLATQGEPRQRIEARTMLLETYNRALAARPDEKEQIKLTASLIELMQGAQRDDLPEYLARAFASKSFQLNLQQMGLIFFRKIHLNQPALELEHYGDQALSEGQYAAAASYFFLAQDNATGIDEIRRLFQKGVGTYMAASRFKDAMHSASQHVGELQYDLPTLRYLSHTARSAGDTKLAADYARRLVFQSPPLAMP